MQDNPDLPHKLLLLSLENERLARAYMTRNQQCLYLQERIAVLEQDQQKGHFHSLLEQKQSQIDALNKQLQEQNERFKNKQEQEQNKEFTWKSEIRKEMLNKYEDKLRQSEQKMNSIQEMLNKPQGDTKHLQQILLLKTEIQRLWNIISELEQGVQVQAEPKQPDLMRYIEDFKRQQESQQHHLMQQMQALSEQNKQMQQAMQSSTLTSQLSSPQKQGPVYSRTPPPPSRSPYPTHATPYQQPVRQKNVFHLNRQYNRQLLSPMQHPPCSLRGPPY